MDNQHRHIKGYRELTAEEIEHINEAKAIAQATGAFIEKIEQAHGLCALLAKGGAGVEIPAPLAVLVKNMQSGRFVCDMRWLAIAKTELQKAHMALIRSIARPTTF